MGKEKKKLFSPLWGPVLHFFIFSFFLPLVFIYVLVMLKTRVGEHLKYLGTLGLRGIGFIAFFNKSLKMII